MPIAKGESWGRPRSLPSGSPIVSTDRALAELFVEAGGGGDRLGPVGLVGGDLCKTLGGRGDRARLRGPEATEVAVDVGVALIDGRRHVFVAHLIARRRCWRGQVLVAMNGAWVGEWNLGPRAHPGDGLLDITEGRLAWRQRLNARRRVRTGEHVPHPDLRQRRAANHDARLDRATPIYIDGVRVASGRQLLLRIEPAALRVVI